VLAPIRAAAWLGLNSSVTMSRLSRLWSRSARWPDRDHATLRRVSKGRLEAFSDGVLAIVITIMVLELVAPHEASLEALAPLWPIFLSYVLSFWNLAIWWNNHHHLLQAAHRVNGRILWANIHLLFWLSLVPFTTAWMGETGFAPLPTAIYGADLLAAALAYYLLVRTLVAIEGADSLLAQALGRNTKGAVSGLLYLAGVALALAAPYAAVAVYVLVAAIWFIPDLRIERRISG
jgi:uncharacterized membrane protein